MSKTNFQITSNRLMEEQVALAGAKEWHELGEVQHQHLLLIELFKDTPNGVPAEVMIETVKNPGPYGRPTLQ